MKYLILIFVLVSSAFPHTYYADNLAPSNGAGTADSPFQTLQAGLNALVPGDTLIVRGSQSGFGQVYNEQPDLPMSGMAGQPIVVQGYPGELVVITYSDKLSLNVDYWVFERLIFDHDFAASDVFRVTGDNNIIRNCEIRNGARDGIDINGGSFNLFENNIIHSFVNGDDLDAHGIILGDGQNNTIRSNEIFDCQGDCIQIYHGDAANTMIENNHLYTTLGSGSENAIDFKSTVSCTVRYNRMHGFRRAASSDGVALKVSHNADNLNIYGNEIYDSNAGFRIGTSSEGTPDHIVFERNLIHDIHDGNDYSYDGYGVQFDGVTDIRFYNNTFVNITGPLFWIADRGVTDLDMRNNLFHGGQDFKGSTSDIFGNSVADYNGWFNCTETIPGSGNDTIGTDPGFAGYASGEYHLAAGSMAIDSGDPSFGSNFPGGIIDLGAFEYDALSSVFTTIRIPSEFTLEQNYPNPFNPKTNISYTLARSGNVQLQVYNNVGQLVSVLVQEYQAPGEYRYEWNADDTRYSHSSGIYLYILSVNGVSVSKKMLLVK